MMKSPLTNVLLEENFWKRGKAMKKCIITIGRQCGSGGHTIGKTVAERLGIPLYDKKLVQIVAERSGLSAETVRREGEYSSASSLFTSVSSRGYSAYSVSQKDGMVLPDQINAYQIELIKELADKGSCVIVGRCADYILQERRDCFHVFIAGELKDRVARVIEEHGISAAAARSHVKDRDRRRSSYYKHITDQVWGMAANYDLCLNSSKLGIDRCVELILAATYMDS